MTAKSYSGTMLEIDGGAMEGGGQILRNAATLSCLLERPIHVHSVRAGRAKPGLRSQHLTGLTLIKEICGGNLEGGAVGSQDIVFRPGKIVCKSSYTADSITAGSICLLMQAAMPCLTFAGHPVDLILKGGTNADMAPQIDHTLMTFKFIAERFGFKFDCDIKKRGYFPKGGGEVHIKSYPVKQLTAIDLTERGDLVRIYGRAFVAGVLPKRLTHIMSRTAQDVLYTEIDKRIPIDIETIREPDHAAVGNGNGIIIIGETSTGCLLAGTALGKRGVPAEKVGQDAAEMLLNNLSHGGCVDDYLQDQLVMLMALAKGKSRIKCGPLSLHTETAIHVAQLLTEVKFNIQELSKSSHIIECEGIALVNEQLK